MRSWSFIIFVVLASIIGFAQHQLLVSTKHRVAQSFIERLKARLPHEPIALKDKFIIEVLEFPLVSFFDDSWGKSEAGLRSIYWLNGAVWGATLSGILTLVVTTYLESKRRRESVCCLLRKQVSAHFHFNFFPEKIGRLEFVIRLFLWMGVMVLAEEGIRGIFDAPRLLDRPATFYVASWGAVLCLSVVCFFAAFIPRVRDIGLSPWMSLIFLIPFARLVALIATMVTPGAFFTNTGNQTSNGVSA